MMDQRSTERYDFCKGGQVGWTTYLVEFVLILEKVGYGYEVMGFSVFKQMNHGLVDRFMGILVKIVGF
jgi:hypothetical protein